MRASWWRIVLGAVPLVGCAVASAQPGPDGYDWATIGSVNNPAYDGPDPFNLVTGRGSVGYEYRMGRFEVTTAQWMEFYNTFKARADPVPDNVLPNLILWGAETDPTYSGPGTRYRLRNVPNAGMIPVAGASWRTSARLVNWLHNDKSSDLSAIADGAYDTSTFGQTAPGVFTDQVAHHPGARYWIPTLDENLKAWHYDPQRFGPGQGGYWQYSHSSDNPPIFGPPGIGEANAQFSLPNFGQYDIPLGSYPNTRSPWGLLDTAGGTKEWLESVRIINDRTYRSTHGSFYGTGGNPESDRVYNLGGEFGNARTSYMGLRIASAVPSPSSLVVFFLGTAVCTFRRNRKEGHPCGVSHQSTGSFGS